MNRVFAFISLIGLVLSAAVHGAALAGVDMSARMPRVWMLHLGVFVVFLPFILSIRKRLGPKWSLSRMAALVPAWVVLVGVALMIYTLANFIIFIASTQGGSPSAENGKYILHSHGRLIREITPAEYAAFRTNELRGFSGHWMWFYFVPFAYFMFAKKPAEGQLQAAAHPPVH